MALTRNKYPKNQQARPKSNFAYNTDQTDAFISPLSSTEVAYIHGSMHINYLELKQT